MTNDNRIIHQETVAEAAKTTDDRERAFATAKSNGATKDELEALELEIAENYFLPKHRAVLETRGVPVLLAYRHGLYAIDLNDQIAEHKAAGCPERKRGDLPLIPTTGLAIPYQKCLDKDDRVRVRSDEEWHLPGEGKDYIEIPRYLTQKGIPVAPYLPYRYRGTAGIGLVTPPKDAPIYVVEAPLKALALLSHDYYAVGLGGVLAGAVDKKASAEVGSIVASPELRRLQLSGRTCNIVFDAGQSWNANVALGVAQVASAVANEGAVVRVVTIPEAAGARDSQAKNKDQGPDDYLVQHGKDAFQALVEAAFDPDPVTRVKTAIAATTGKEAQSEAVLALLDCLVFRACLHLGGVRLAAAVIAASKKVLNSTLLKEVGGEFRALIQVRKKKADAPPIDEDCPYAVVDGCTVRVLKQGHQHLANFSAKIVEEKIVKSAEGTSIVFGLEGRLKTAQTLERINVKAADYKKMDWIYTMWGPSPCIEAGMDNSVRAAIQMLSSPLQKTVYCQTGWQSIGRPVYMLPGGGIGFQGSEKYEVEVPGLERYKIGVPPKDREAAQAAMRAPLELLQAVAPDRLTAPLLCFTYLAPLASMIGGIPMVLWLKGQTGCGKSSLAALAQCHFGEFGRHSLPENWSSTVNAIEKRVAAARDTLITIDNLVPANNGKEQIDAQSKATRLIQNIGDGQTRNRANNRGELVPGAKLRAAVVATAEILPPGEGESTLGRCLVLEMERGDLNIPSVKQLCDHFLPDFGVAMAGYIQWLAGLESEEIKSAHKEAQSYAMQDHPELLGAHPRTRDSLALLTLGQIMFVRYAGTLGVSASYLTSRIQAGLLEAAWRQPRPIAATAVDLWLSTLNSLLMGGTVSLADSPTGSLHSYNHGETKVGWISGTEIWLDPELSYSVVAKHLGARWTYSKSELQRQLRTAKTTMDDGTEIAVLARRGDGDHTCYRLTTGTRPRVLALDSRCLPGAGAVSIDLDDDDDDDDAALAGLLDDAGPHLH